MIIDTHAHYNHNSFKNSYGCFACPFRRKHDDF